MDKCLCGRILHVDAGDSLQMDIYRWYASYRCVYCGEYVEIDGSGINTIPKDIEKVIIKKGGKWGIKNLANNIKINYLMKKYIFSAENNEFKEEYCYIGTYNQIEWVKKVLIKKGISESELLIEKI